MRASGTTWLLIAKELGRTQASCESRRGAFRVRRKTMGTAQTSDWLPRSGWRIGHPKARTADSAFHPQLGLL